MAEVYLAKFEWAHGLEKTVVVKRILEHIAQDPNFIAMFFSEAQLASRLNHPNVIQIIEFGEAEGIPFLAMEYVEGLTLRELVLTAIERGERLPVPHCARIAATACEALAYAHELVDPETGVPLQLIHRDVSLDNILVSTAGAVKLVDFGIAKAVTQVHHTKTGVIKGKLSYMAPEQVRGEPLDRRVDVYGLGIVLYELVAGAKPFENTSEAELLHEIVYGTRIPLRGPRPDAPPELERIVNRALERDRGNRYSDCRVLHADLENFLLSCRQPVNAFQLAELVKHYAGNARNAGAAAGPIELPPTRAAPDEASVTAPRPELTGEQASTEQPTVMERPRVAVGQGRPSSGGKPRSGGGRVRATRAELVALLSKRPGLSIPIGLGLFFAALLVVLLVRGLSDPPAPTTTSPERTATAPAPPSDVVSPPPTPSDATQAQREKDRAKAQDLLVNALSLLESGRDPGPAEPQLVACLQLDPGNPDCHLALSTLYVRQKNRTQAMEHVRKFLKLAPDRATEAQPVFEELHALRVKAAPPRAPTRGATSPGQKTGAKTTVRRDPVTAPPGSPPPPPDPGDPSDQELSNALCEEGKALLSQKQYKQATSLFTSCLNLDKRNAECNLGLGRSWANLGNTGKAARYYREFLRLAPSHPLAGDVQVLVQQYEGQ
jgi:serine/threonine-protein kinase